MSSRMRILVTVASLLALLLLMLLIAERAVALAQRLAALPAWLTWLVCAALAAFALAAAWLAWRLLRPRKRRPVGQIDRAGIEQRLGTLEARGADTAPLRAELGELDRRQAGGALDVALFGEISSGKSSLIAALAPHADARIDVVGGSTRSVRHVEGALPGGRSLRLADVPGSREHGGEQREALARNEALRAHVVVYVASGDLSRAQTEELRWLGSFGKPMVLVLNKADQWSEPDRQALLARLRQRGDGLVDEVVATRAGGSERFVRECPDGSSERVERAAPAEIEALAAALEKVTAPGARALDAARERAVLAGLHERTGTLEAGQRALESERIVARYTRRAVVGAMAAVAPGSDLVIQGALASAMARELGKVHGIGVTELEIEAFLKHARVTLRTSASVVLAIAGNALKAFPGLGTLGGGVLHAFAYALIFDSLGKALAATLADRQRLDSEAAGRQLRDLLNQANGARMKRLAAVTVDAIRHPQARQPPSGDA